MSQREQFFEAILAGNIAEISAQLVADPPIDVNIRYKHQTPLFFAINKNVPNLNEVVTLLLQAGADVNIMCRRHMSTNTALGIALLEHKFDVALAILNTEKVDLKILPYLSFAIEGEAPADIITTLIVEYAARGDRKNLFKGLDEAVVADKADIVTELLRIYPEFKTKSLSQNLGYANSANVAQILINNGADVNFVDSYNGQTPLMKCNSAEIAVLLINAGADVNAATKHGKTVLMIHSEVLNDDIVSILLEKGARIESVDKEGNNALMYAAEDLTPSVVTLLNAGADFQQRNTLGQSAVDIAVKTMRQFNAHPHHDAEIQEMIEMIDFPVPLPVMRIQLNALSDANYRVFSLFENIKDVSAEREYTAASPSERAKLKQDRAELFKSLVHPKLLSTVRYTVRYYTSKLDPDITALGCAARLGHVGAIAALEVAGISFRVPGDAAGNSASAIASRAGWRDLADQLARKASKEVARSDELYRLTRSKIVVGNRVGLMKDVVDSVLDFIAAPGVFIESSVALPPPPGGAAAEEPRLKSRQRRRLEGGLLSFLFPSFA